MTYRTLKLTLLLLVLLLIVPVTTAQAQDGPVITITALNVSSGVGVFPLNGYSWDIDPWYTGIGHLQGTAWFDTPGNIALGGHSWMPDQTPGIFVALHRLQVGDSIIVTVGGQERHYAVPSVGSVSLNDLTVLYPTSHERLTLITCDAASYDEDSNMYYRRVVVTADRIS